MQLLFTAMAILVCASVQTSAQDSNQRTVLEFANTKCETWTQKRLSAARHADASVMESWAFGFVSGVNFSTGDDKKAQDFLSSVEPDFRGKPNVVTSWLDEYCRAHPQERFVRDLIALAAELKNRAQRR